jgi:UDP-glucose 4-epimerase
MAVKKEFHIIAGGAGFIGLNLAMELLDCQRNSVTIIDNLSNAHIQRLNELLKAAQYRDRIAFEACDISDYCHLKNAWDTIKKGFKIRYPRDNYTDKIMVWHLAANSDIPSGIEDPGIDLRDTFMTTYNLLKLCKEENLRSFAFASSSAIYGDHGEKPISENTAPLMPISNYGAMKLASEAICFAAKHEFLKNLLIFRFPNVVGVPATHGVIFDFINKLKTNPSQLSVLGDGTQRKSYLHVSDLIKGMVMISEAEISESEAPVFNLGPMNDSVSVKEIAEMVRDLVSPNATITYGITPYGWKGDVPRFNYNIEKVISHGWTPELSSQAAVLIAAQEIFAQIYG